MDLTGEPVAAEACFVAVFEGFAWMRALELAHHFCHGSGAVLDRRELLRGAATAVGDGDIDRVFMHVHSDVQRGTDRITHGAISFFFSYKNLFTRFYEAT